LLLCVVPYLLALIPNPQSPIPMIAFIKDKNEAKKNIII